MKLILTINSINLILTPEQAEIVTNALQGCEHIEQKYMGRNSGNSEYMDYIKPAAMRDALKMGVMSTTDYDAMVFITKQQAEAK